MDKADPALEDQKKRRERTQATACARLASVDEAVLLSKSSAPCHRPGAASRQSAARIGRGPFDNGGRADGETAGSMYGIHRADDYRLLRPDPSDRRPGPDRGRPRPVERSEKAMNVAAARIDAKSPSNNGGFLSSEICHIYQSAPQWTITGKGMA